VCYRVYGWRHLVKATEVTAGLVESNGSLLPGDDLRAVFGRLPGRNMAWLLVVYFSRQATTRGASQLVTAYNRVTS